MYGLAASTECTRYQRNYRMISLGSILTLLEPQFRFGDKPLKFQVVYPQNGTAVLKGLTRTVLQFFSVFSGNFGVFPKLFGEKPKNSNPGKRHLEIFRGFQEI